MNKPFLAALSLLGPVAAHTAYAEVFLTEDKAVGSIFPAASEKFEKIRIDLSPLEIKQIESKSDETVRGKTLTVWKNSKGDVVFVDQVVGKHEFITLAVGVNKHAGVEGIEILEYRESYGSEVRQKNWRNQFRGKVASSPLKLDQDISNISGATLSSAHVTDGVRRLLHTYEVIKAKL